MKKIQQGFTFIELLLVMSVIAILTTFVSVALINSRASTSLETVTATFMADLKSQQIKSMVGDTEGRGTPNFYGIYLDQNKYVLFHGDTYLPQSAENFEISMDNSVRITTTFPNNVVQFASQSGELSNFNAAQNSITFSDTSTTKSKTFLLNKYGVIYAEN